MAKHDGGFVYPGNIPRGMGTAYVSTTPGMTMRQAYKMAALTGALAASSLGKTWDEKHLQEQIGMVADAMLAEDEAFKERCHDHDF